MAHPVKLFLGREPPSVRPLVDDGATEARRLERVQDRRNGREPIPVNCQEAREGLFQYPETTRRHVGRRDDDPMRNPGDLTQGRRIVPESDNGIGLTEELGEAAGPCSDVEDMLPIPQTAHIDEPAKPELAVRGLVARTRS